ncbi:hypothetical protein LTR85_006355 [Meristemomyces frigidus]|nr:hypothetical protein LTR85_006355 [Meristemomyces frigidus]
MPPASLDSDTTLAIRPRPMATGTTMEGSQVEDQSLPQSRVRREEVARIIYSPLLFWEIRVLALHPGQASAPLAATLERAVLTYQAPFEALSYTWGPAVFSHDIQVNGHRYCVTESLGEALRHLRHPDQTKYIWADALCINQFDDAEKARQIRIMRVIYQKAERVVVWLGASNRKIDMALRLVSAFGDFAEWNRIYGDERYFRILRRQAASARLLSSQAAADIVEGMSEVMNRPWSSRAWVVQEQKAAQDLVVHCGDNVMSFWTLAALPQMVVQFLAVREDVQGYSLITESETAMAVIKKLDWIRDLGPDGCSPQVYSQISDMVAELSERDAMIGSSNPLVQLQGIAEALQKTTITDNVHSATTNLNFLASALPDGSHHIKVHTTNGYDRERTSSPAAQLDEPLHRAAHLKATDDRDRIYALLGLTSVSTSYAGESDADGDSPLLIDYRLAASQVFQLAAKFLMNSYRHCGPLYYVSDRDPTATGLGLPSWTPDWRSVRLAGYLRDLLPGWGGSPQRSSGEALEEWDIRWIERLRDQGFLADFERYGDRWHEVCYIDEHKSMLRLTGHVLGCVTDVSRAPTVLSASEDEQVASCIATIHHSQCFKDVCRLRVAELRNDKDLESSYGTGLNGARARLATLRNGMRRDKIRDYVESFELLKRFTEKSSEKSSWAGSGQCQVGDIVLLAIGGLLPLVLRRRSGADGYVFVGYVALAGEVKLKGPNEKQGTRYYSQDNEMHPPSSVGPPYFYHRTTMLLYRMSELMQKAAMAEQPFEVY